MAMENVFKVNKDMMEDGAESMKKLFEVNSQYFSECIELSLIHISEPTRPY